MVVEDDRALRELLVIVLRAQGFEVTAAGNGLEALEKLTLFVGRPPGLFVVDLMMPLFSGWELVEHLQTTDFASVPILILSAHAAAPPVGVAAVLQKPVQQALLIETVKRLYKEPA